jgi:hypothetical protein
MSFMGQLLSGNAPLRGRAGFELVVPTLDHQLAAEFWEVGDPAIAVKVNTVVGGTRCTISAFTTRSWPRSPPATRSAAASGRTSAVSPAIWRIRSRCSRTAARRAGTGRLQGQPHRGAAGHLRPRGQWSETKGLGHLDRLRRIRQLTARKQHGAAGARLVCCGGAGFADDLVAAAHQDDDIVLVGLADLYRREPGGQ